MGLDHCDVPGCDSGTEAKVKYHQLPSGSAPSRLTKWLLTIGVGPSVVGDKSPVLCSRHFLVSTIDPALLNKVKAEPTQALVKQEPMEHFVVSEEDPLNTDVFDREKEVLEEGQSDSDSDIECLWFRTDDVANSGEAAIDDPESDRPPSVSGYFYQSPGDDNPASPSEYEPSESSIPDDPYPKRRPLKKKNRSHVKEESSSDREGNSVINCPHCDKTFKKKSSFRSHLRTKHATEPKAAEYKCYYCKEAFRTGYNRLKHLRQHVVFEKGSRKVSVVPRMFECHVCTKQFGVKLGLERHTRTHVEELPFPCKLCRVRFPLKTELAAHLTNHKPLRCFQCKNVFSSYVERKRHKCECGMSCKVCRDVFNTTKLFTRHISNQHPYLLVAERKKSSFTSRPKKHECNVCFKKFRMPCLLRKHTRIHTGEKPFACTICDRRFTHPENHYKHMKTHLGRTARVPTFTCDLCDKRLMTAESLRIHRMIHTGKEHECDFCSKLFLTKSQLRNHTNTHTGQKPYSCDTCGRCFSHPNSLKRHLLMHSMDERPFKCTFCDQRFWQKVQRTVHERTHTGEKPHKCELCGAAFAQSGPLKIHRMYHSGERPHVCDECGYRYVKLSELKIHKTRAHTGPQPFLCDCGCKFSNKGDYKRHVKMHDQEWELRYREDEILGYFDE